MRARARVRVGYGLEMGKGWGWERAGVGVGWGGGGFLRGKDMCQEYPNGGNAGMFTVGVAVAQANSEHILRFCVTPGSLVVDAV